MWRDVRDHECCPTEVGLNSDSFEHAGLSYSEERIEAFGKNFGGFKAAGVAIQETNGE